MEETIVKEVQEEQVENVDLGETLANIMAETSEETDKEKDDHLGESFRFLLFELEEEQYGVNIEYVIEIIGIQDITYLPEMPKFVKGLINLRGKIIPVIDAREKFGKQKALYNERTCIIVLKFDEITVGLVVDIISDVITIREGEMEEAPKIGKIKTNKYISNIAKVEGKVKLLVDCEKLINE